MRKRLVYFSQRKRLVYLSLSLAAALAALFTQVSTPRAVAQRPLPDNPTQECRACDASCTVAYESCTAETCGRGPGHGQCVRRMQECRRTCHGRGGPCDAPSEQAPTPTPTPTRPPD